MEEVRLLLEGMLVGVEVAGSWGIRCRDGVQ